MRGGNFLTAVLVLLYACVWCARAEEPFIDWETLENPVYSRPGWSTKDACMAFRDGWFYIFFSAFYRDDGRERSHVVGVKTRDFKEYSEPLFNWRGEEGGWIGMCSPNLTVAGDTFYLTYNSWGDRFGKPNQLFYATSKDLENWERGKPLARDITKWRRAIDAAVAAEGSRYYLIWKEFQKPRAAVAAEMGPAGWTRLGKVGPAWFENGELIKIEGKWRLVCTARQGGREDLAPFIREMDGSGDKDKHWASWGDFLKLDVPMEKFNTDHVANACFLADWRRHDGHFYLIYAGRTEGKTHKRRGDNKLGLARSKDLVHWEVPCAGSSK